MRSMHACASLLMLSLAATACSTIGESSTNEHDASGKPTQVVLVTHDSFSLPKPLERKFEQESGFDLVKRASGDAGALTNKLVLTQDHPLGDVSFGVDNTFG